MLTSLRSLQARVSLLSNCSTSYRRVAAVLMFVLTLIVGASARADSFTYTPTRATTRSIKPNTADRVGQAGTDASVRVYYVGEDAGYANSPGFFMDGEGVTSANPLLLFLDASSPVFHYGSQMRTSSEPLFPGDFLAFDRCNAGSILDFFMIANARQAAEHVCSNDDLADPDLIGRVPALIQANNPYWLISSDEMHAGDDREFNDLLLAADVSNQSSVSLIHFVSLNEVPADKPHRILAWVRERNERRSSAYVSQTGLTY